MSRERQTIGEIINDLQRKIEFGNNVWRGVRFLDQSSSPSQVHRGRDYSPTEELNAIREKWQHPSRFQRGDPTPQIREALRVLEKRIDFVTGKAKQDAQIEAQLRQHEEAQERRAREGSLPRYRDQDEYLPPYSRR